MTLIATAGAADQNSFVSLVEFDEFLTTKLRKPVAVTGAYVIDREAALIWATRLVSTLCWTGSGSTDTQALVWPRTGMLYKTGFAVAIDAIPADLKNATMEMAYLLLVGDPITPASAIFKGISKIKAGSVELQFQKLADLGTAASLVPLSVIAFLPKDWLCPVDELDLVFDAL